MKEGNVQEKLNIFEEFNYWYEQLQRVYPRIHHSLSLKQCINRFIYVCHAATVFTTISIIPWSLNNQNHQYFFGYL